jgi:hypothetical protein
MSFASDVEARLRGQPHVGAVVHFEGIDVAGLATRLRHLLDDSGLGHEAAFEEANGAPMFNAVAAVAVGEGMRLWLCASEKPGVGCKLELRLFHTLEDSAQADEYLTRFRERMNA